jgi:hypothetical protein
MSASNFTFNWGKFLGRYSKCWKVPFTEHIMKNNTSFWVVFQAWEQCNTPLKMLIAWVVQKWVQQMKMWNWIKKLILKNIGITIQEVYNILEILFWSVQSILKENLIMCQTAAKFMFCPVHPLCLHHNFCPKTKRLSSHIFLLIRCNHVTSFSQNSRCH